MTVGVGHCDGLLEKNGARSREAGPVQLVLMKTKLRQGGSIKSLFHFRKSDPSSWHEGVLVQLVSRTLG